MSVHLEAPVSFHSARLRYLIGRILLYVSAALIVVWSAAPFLWQFSTSFQLDRDLVGAVPKLWPDPTINEFSR
jgi:multiple sugar transport system permease protein